MPSASVPTPVRYVLTEKTDQINVVGASTGGCSYALASSVQEVASETTPAKPFEIDLTKGITGKTIMPGSVHFTLGGVRYIDRLGKIYRNPDPKTGLGAECGTIDYTTGLVTLDTYDTGDNTIAVHSLLARFGRQFLPTVTFRTPGAPLRPGSFQLIGVMADGTQIAGSGEMDGTVGGTMIKGSIDYQTGIVALAFGAMVSAFGREEETWYDPDDVVGGMIWEPMMAVADSLVYTCVAYSYIPLDADLLGLDPVRLPADGRVPIVKPGDVVVIHNTQTTQLPNPLSAGQHVTLPREGISHVELYDANEQYVPSTKYTWSEQAQTLTMASPLDLTEFVQPLFAMHRVEDMSLVSQVQINGQVILANGVAHAYPASDTYVSSALKFGDLRSRYYNLFDQKTWTNAWSDTLIGDAANATYNEVNYPILVTNQGAVKERWAIVFTGPTDFYVMGEKLGIVATGYTTNDCQPINPATGQPFFFIDYRGWGSGWASGNVVRFNTDGANADLWVARTTLQGPVTEPNDQFTIQIRGDAE